MVSTERIASVPLFAGLAHEELETVAAAAGELKVESGDVLAAEGDFGHALFVIEQGHAEVIADGQVVAQLGPADVFGEIAVLRAGRRTATVVATSSMELITFFKTDLWRIERELPEVAAKLREAVDARLAR